MPQLKCTVQTCVHNKQFLCDLDEEENLQKIRKRHVVTAFRRERKEVTQIL